MATYHVSIKIATKNDQGFMRASAHHAYLARLDRYGEKCQTDEELVQVESGNMPSWAKEDVSVFWLASDTYERKNGSVYRELEAALPRELSSEKQREIVDNFIDEVLGTEHPYFFAIHSKAAADGLPQPHVHLMWSERRMDGIERDPVHFFRRAAAARRRKDGQIKRQPDAAEGGCKKVSMHKCINDFRALWANLLNGAYANAGLELSVSHLTLYDQGIVRDPERHLGPVRMRGDDGKMLLARRKAREEADATEAEGLRIMAELARTRKQQARIRELFRSTTPRPR